MAGMSPSLRVISDTSYSGTTNMAADAFLLKNAIETQSKDATLRYYRFNEPTITVGYALWKRAQWNIRGGLPINFRITGGGIVRHGEDLVFSFVSPIEAHPSFQRASDSYRFLHSVLKEALEILSLPVSLYEGACQGNEKQDCFENPVCSDLMLGKRKVAGGGQKRSFGYLLHQGSIAWDVLLNEKPNINESEFHMAFSKKLAIYLNRELQIKSWSDWENEQFTKGLDPAHGYARASF